MRTSSDSDAPLSHRGDTQRRRTKTERPKSPQRGRSHSLPRFRAPDAEGEPSGLLPSGVCALLGEGVPLFDPGRYLGAATYMTVVAERPRVDLLRAESLVPKPQTYGSIESRLWWVGA